MISQRFGKFVLVGGIAAVANFGSRFGFSQIVGYPAAITLAYCVGMTVAFTLNRGIVFQDAGTTLPRQVMWFIIVNMAGLAQTLVASILIATEILPRLGIVHYRDAIAHGFGLLIPIFISYIGHKHLTFKTA